MKRQSVLQQLKMNNLLFAKGDLIHVPQSVIMYGSSVSSGKIYVNQKPMLAIFVNYKGEGLAEVVMNGQKWLVKNSDIFLNKE